MAHEHDSEGATVDAIDAAARAAADELEGSDSGVMVTGWILAASYVTADGDHLWTIRTRPDQPFMTTAGLGMVAERWISRIADDLVGDDED